MKKNLNIAYLNGAEGMIRRGGASSGGSGSSNNEEDENIVYLNVFLDGFDAGLRSTLLSCSCAIAYDNFGSSYHVLPSSAMMMNHDLWSESRTRAIAIDLNAEIVDFDTAGNATRYTVKDRLINVGVFDIVNDIPKLTKEQFYNFDF